MRGCSGVFESPSHGLMRGVDWGVKSPAGGNFEISHHKISISLGKIVICDIGNTKKFAFGGSFFKQSFYCKFVSPPQARKNWDPRPPYSRVFAGKSIRVGDSSWRHFISKGKQLYGWSPVNLTFLVNLTFCRPHTRFSAMNMEEYSYHQKLWISP